MSADNYLYVAKRANKYAIVMRFASSDYAWEVEEQERPISEHDSVFEAHQEAARLDFTGIEYTEYGVSISPAAAEALGFNVVIDDSPEGPS